MSIQRTPRAGATAILLNLVGICLAGMVWLVLEGLWALGDLIKLLEQR